MFSVASGKAADDLAELQNWEEWAIARGTGGRIIFLNGGSEARSDMIAYWQQYARVRNVGCEVRGRCMIIVGGRT